jgi:L-threonylcarbamoyladenylate synthase
VNHWQLRQTARTIERGGIIAYPTEAVFGLGCDPLNPDAVLRLLALKRRPVDKGLVLIASNIEQLAPFMAPLNTRQQDTLKASWPGPVTWLVPAKPETPVWLKGHHDTIAVRVTDHPIAAALCKAAGYALVSTSANRSGCRPAKTPLQVRNFFSQQGNQPIDKIVAGPLGNEAKPSIIKDLSTGKTIRPAYLFISKESNT